MDSQTMSKSKIYDCKNTCLELIRTWDKLKKIYENEFSDKMV